MKINGRDVTFKATIRAVITVAELCPDKDINRVQELFNGMDASTLHASVKVIAALANGTLTEDEILGLDVNELQTVLDAAMSAFKCDQKPTVEVLVKKDEATEAEA